LYNNPPKTLFTGQKLIFLPECHSTNDIAAGLLEDSNIPEGTVIITSHQTHGRGQRGNTWQTEPGQNLTFSVIVKPAFLSIDQQFGLNIAVSLAVHHFLLQYVPHYLSIKWPNDIYWKSWKLGGILIENTVQGTGIVHSVIGIGLNINQKTFSGELRASSLALATPASTQEDAYTLEILLNELLVFLETYYLKLRAGNIDSLKSHYLQNLLGYAESRLFRSGGIVFEGVIIGVEDSGKLLVEKDNGIRSFSFKEIDFLFDS